MRSRTPARGMLLAFFIIAISFWNFTMLDGRECIRPIHIAALLTAGVGIGVFIVNLFLYLGSKRKGE